MNRLIQENNLKKLTSLHKWIGKSQVLKDMIKVVDYIEETIQSTFMSNEEKEMYYKDIFR